MHHINLFLSTSSRSLVVHTALIMAIDVFCLYVHLPLIWHLEAPDEGETPLGVAVDGTLGGSRPSKDRKDDGFSAFSILQLSSFVSICRDDWQVFKVTQDA